MRIEPFEPFHDWWEFTYDDFTRVAEILGFDVSPRDIQFSGFWSQGDGASFTGSYSYAKGAAKRIRAEYPNEKDLHDIADMLQDMQRRNFYQITGSIVRIGYHYSHSNTIAAGVGRDSDNYQEPTDDAESVVTESARRLSDWLYSTLESEFEYLSYDDAGRQCGDAMRETAKRGREWIAAMREIRAAFKARHAPLPLDTIRDFIRRRIHDARVACEEYRDARQDAHAMIDESKPGKRGWRAKYRDAWIQGYESGC